MLDDLTIGEVARRAGVRSSALRYYESIGLLPVARRVNGRRRYAPDTIRMLAVIRLAQQAGFTIAEMQTLFHGFEETTRPGDRWLPLAEHKLEELDTLINRARQMQYILQRRATVNTWRSVGSTRRTWSGSRTAARHESCHHTHARAPERIRLGRHPCHLPRVKSGNGTAMLP